MEKLKEVIISEKIKKLFIKKAKINRKIDDIINEQIKELKKECTHSSVKIIDENHPGGYLNIAEYNKITICNYCDLELKRKTTYGGYE